MEIRGTRINRQGKGNNKQEGAGVNIINNIYQKKKIKRRLAIHLPNPSTCTLSHVMDGWTFQHIKHVNQPARYGPPYPQCVFEMCIVECVLKDQKHI